jgi:hypothetical protein
MVSTRALEAGGEFVKEKEVREKANQVIKRVRNHSRDQSYGRGEERNQHDPELRLGGRGDGGSKQSPTYAGSFSLGAGHTSTH